MSLPTLPSYGSYNFGKTSTQRTRIDPAVYQLRRNGGLMLSGEIVADRPLVHSTGQPVFLDSDIAFTLRALLKDASGNLEELNLVDASGDDVSGLLYTANVTKGAGPKFSCPLDASKTSTKLVIIQSIYRMNVNTVVDDDAESGDDENDTVFLVNDEREYDVVHEIFPPKRNVSVRLISDYLNPSIAFCINYSKGINKLRLTITDPSNTAHALDFDINSVTGVPSNSNLRVVSNTLAAPIAGFVNGDIFGRIPIVELATHVQVTGSGNNQWGNLDVDKMFRASVVAFNNNGSSLPMNVEFSTNLKPTPVNNLTIVPSIVNNVFKGLQISGNTEDINAFKASKAYLTISDGLDAPVLSNSASDSVPGIELLSYTGNESLYTIDGNNVSGLISIESLVDKLGYAAVNDESKDDVLEMLRNKPLIGVITLRRYTASATNYVASIPSNKAPFLFSIYGAFVISQPMTIYENVPGPQGYHFTGELRVGTLSKGKLNLNIKLKNNGEERYNGSYVWDTMAKKDVNEDDFSNSFPRRLSENLQKENLEWHVSLIPSLLNDVNDSTQCSVENKSLLLPLVNNFLQNYSQNFTLSVSNIVKSPVTPTISGIEVYEKLIIVNLSGVSNVNCSENVVNIERSFQDGAFAPYTTDWVNHLVASAVDDDLNEVVNIIGANSLPEADSSGHVYTYRVSVYAKSSSEYTPDGSVNYSHDFRPREDKAVVPVLTINHRGEPKRSNPTFSTPVLALGGNHTYTNLDLLWVNDLGAKIATLASLNAGQIADQLAVNGSTNLSIVHNLEEKRDWRFCLELSGRYTLGLNDRSYTTRSEIKTYSTASQMTISDVKMSNVSVGGVLTGQVTFHLDTGGHALTDLSRFNTKTAVIVTIPSTSVSNIGPVNMLTFVNLVSGNNSHNTTHPFVVNADGTGPILILAALHDEGVFYRNGF